MALGDQEGWSTQSREELGGKGASKAARDGRLESVRQARGRGRGSAKGNEMDVRH